MKSLYITHGILGLCFAIVALFAPSLAAAQTRQEVINSGTDAFVAKRYADAVRVLQPITTPNDRDAKLNFYYGASLVMIGQQPEEALRRLGIAQVRGFMRNEANLYIGRAHQLLCDYEKAAESYAKCVAPQVDAATAELAARYAQECESAIRIASKIFSVKVARKTKTTEEHMLDCYALSPDAGVIQQNRRFFESDVDPDGIMYMTQRADAVYFSMGASDGREHLMKMEKLIGGWGDAQILEGTLVDGNDRTPFLLTDGVTLFFASDRLGGMGGYDIYRTTYDAETRTFSEPINIGVPFNSPADDFLFVPDEFNRRAWFASNRETLGTDSIMIYEVIWDDSVVRSMAKSTDEIRTALQLNIDPEAAETAALIANKKSAVAGGSFKVKEQFRLAICDSLTYTQWEHFREPKASATYKQVMDATAQKDSLTKVMAEQRKKFMETASNIDRNALLQELLTTERSLYSLVDEIDAKTERTRNLEIQTLQRLIAQGKYKSLSSIKIGAKEQAQRLDWDSWLRPRNFTVYSHVFFDDARSNVDDETRSLFDANEQKALALQDSLVAWARIVSLEADKMEALAVDGMVVETIGADGRPERLQADQALKRAQTYRVAAIELVSRAQNRRLEIYDALFRRLRTKLVGYDTGELDDLRDKAVRYFEVVTYVDVYKASAEEREKVMLMKRRGMEDFTKCLMRYTVHADGSFPLPTSATPMRELSKLPDLSFKSNLSPLADANVAPAKPKGGSVSDPKPSDKPQPTRPAPEVEAKPAEPAAPADAEKKMPAQKIEEALGKKDAPAEANGAKAHAPDAKQDVPAGMTYKIQMGAFRSRPAACDQLNDPKAVHSVPVPGRNLLRFYYGNYASRDAALADVPHVVSKGFDGAFVVAFDAKGQQIKE